jgi:hypothetical protein
VGWLNIKGCCTLGVTWSGSGSFGPEADMAINNRFQWTTDANAAGGSVYDLETVLLHELGHVLGLGHSSDTNAVMVATYADVRRNLRIDDQRGVTYLYPEAGAVGNISGTVNSSSGQPIAGAAVTIPGVPVTATTNAQGEYSLGRVPNIDSYSVTASASNFTSQTISGVVVGGSADFILQPSSGGGGGGGGCKPRGPFGCN